MWQPSHAHKRKIQVRDYVLKPMNFVFKMMDFVFYNDVFCNKTAIVHAHCQAGGAGGGHSWSRDGLSLSYINEDSSIGDEDPSMILQFTKLTILLLNNDDFAGRQSSFIGAFGLIRLQ